MQSFDQNARRPIRRGGRRRSVLFAAFVLSVIGVVTCVVWIVRRPDGLRQRPEALRASSSDRPSEAISGPATSFDELVVASVLKRGYLTVTVHVGLADRRLGHLAPVAARFGDGDDPGTNQYWGALFGVETHFANADGWRRIHTDSGDGIRILRRVAFHRTVVPNDRWRDRGISDPFGVYLLALAWPSRLLESAMEQPLRDALTGRTLVLELNRGEVAFGGGSVIVGYVGQNAMLGRYWDPFDGLPAVADRGAGVFFLCWKSAVYLHRDVVDRGLYPVLFVRQQIVPEAYVVDGIMNALLEGGFDGGFVEGAAREYARFQRGISPERASSMFFR